MLSFLYKKKNIQHTTLLNGMTDLHCHLLYGVDDGFETEEEALEMLSFFRQTGVQRVYLTPHVSDEYPGNTPTFLQARYEQLARVAPLGIELRLAAEYMLDAGFRERMAAGLLTFPGRRVLVETSYMAAPINYLDLLYDLLLEGYTPVIAHPERYMYMTDVDYYLLKCKGYKFQLNLFSLCNHYGQGVQTKARALLNRGAYDYVGSDCHDIDCYKAGLKQLSLSCSEQKKLQRLLDNNNSL